MDDENLTQDTAEQTPPVEDDLLGWMPPELTQRARYTAEKDAGIYPSKKKKKVDFNRPPAGKHRTLSLAMLIGGAVLLALSTTLAAAGANGEQAVLEKGRIWYALWIVGQAASMCVYLLFLLPLSRDMRRPALFTIMGAGLLCSLGGGLIAILSQRGDYPLGFMIATTAFTLLLALAFTPSVWLLLGLARGKTSEKAAAVMGCVNVLVQLIGLIGKLTGSGTQTPPAYVTALDVVQCVCYVILLFNWPVLERPVLLQEAPAAPDESEGDKNDEQPE